MPRRFNPLELGLDLLINFIEVYVEDFDKLGWGSVAGIKGAMSGARQTVQGASGNAQILMPFFETGLKGLLYAALPNMGPEAKITMNSVLDLVTDRVRKAMNEPNDDKAEAMLVNASGDAHREFKKILDDAKKRATLKPPFNVLLMKLLPGERTRIHAWVHDIETNDPTAHKRWNEFKDRISTIEEFREILNMATTEERLSYLRMAYGREPTFLDTAKATVLALAKGEETAHTIALREKMSAGAQRMKESADKTAARLALKRKLSR